MKLFSFFVVVVVVVGGGGGGGGGGGCLFVCLLSLCFWYCFWGRRGVGGMLFCLFVVTVLTQHE